MFGDTLLESSSTGRKGKKWPMAAAFTAEAIVGAIVVIVPLLSTGVIPVSARVPIYSRHLLTITAPEIMRWLRPVGRQINRGGAGQQQSGCDPLGTQ